MDLNPNPTKKKKKKEFKASQGYIPSLRPTFSLPYLVKPCLKKLREKKKITI
jgi:hypothetical protein